MAEQDRNIDEILLSIPYGLEYSLIGRFMVTMSLLDTSASNMFASFFLLADRPLADTVINGI